MQPGAPGAWNPQGGGAPAGYGQPQQQQQPGGYQQAPQPGGYQQAPQGYGQPAQAQPPQQPMGGFGGGNAAAMAADLQKGFVGAMFDFSFNNYVTPKIVKVLYGLWILFAALTILAGMGGGVMQIVSTYGSAGLGIVQILIAPFAGILVLILGRVYMEVLIVLFKIAENLGDINRKTKD
jgi:hypothetical protein